MKDQTKMFSTDCIRKKQPKDNEKPLHQSHGVSKSETSIMTKEEDNLGLEDDLLQNLDELDDVGDLEGPQNSLNFEEERRVKEILTKFQTAMHDYNQSKVNIFSIDKPNMTILATLIKMWSGRQIKTEKMLLDLFLTNVSIPLQMMKDVFDSIPSIKLSVNNQRIQSKGRLFAIGEYFYEGTEKRMTISSQSMESCYIGEVKNNAMHGVGQFISTNKLNGFKYEGEFDNNRFHGQGKHSSNQNLVYIGEFRNDYKEGFGEQVQFKRKKNAVWGDNPFIEKSKYRGPFKQGDREGKGIEETKKFVYNGDWKKGVKCGQGQIRYKNGDYYKGQWANGEFNGKGQYFQSGNSTYKGSFVDGKYEGNGCMEYENGDKYEGQYTVNKKHGQGIYTWGDGDYYDGQWINDSAEGHGTSMIGTDFYDGEFKNGKRHGQGELTNQDGDIIHAMWQNNEIVKTLEKNGQPV